MARLNPLYHARAAWPAPIAWQRSSRSRSARRVMLTRYAMPCFKLGEKLPDGAEPAVPCIFQTLPDALVRVGVSGDVEQVLIGFRILNYGLSFALNCQHHGAPVLLKLFHEPGGIAPKAG